MKATVLIDNVSNNELVKEWGLAIYIEWNGKKILLDAGASGSFADNAAAMGIELSAVDYAVLSHAHFDHSDGMERFFAENDHAKFFLQKSCGENCYAKEGLRGRYIGIKKGTLSRFQDRICYADGENSPIPGMTLLPHSTHGLSAVGKKAGMYRRIGLRRKYDDFSHEQSLVFQTEKGLVVFNSCCHAGADVIVQEVQHAFLGEKIYALIGGFHLYETPDDDVRAFARRLLDTGVESVWTGHCTGDRAMEILKQEMGERAHSLYTGLCMELA